MSGAAHTAMISASVSLLRRTRTFVSDLRDGIENHDRECQCEPLECVPVVFLDSEIRRLPIAHEIVVERIVLPDHERLHTDRHRLAIAFDSEVLPNCPLDH